MRIVFSSARRNRGIPWWLIVGALGFILFGGWKGFFGAIAGVILIPIALLILFALGFFFWMLYLSRKHGKSFQHRSPFEFEQQNYPRPQSGRGDVIESEAKVIKSADPESPSS